MTGMNVMRAIAGVCSAAALLMAPAAAGAQDHHHHGADTSAMVSTDMMAGALGISMDRMGSGTTWIPDAVAVPGFHRMGERWTFMAHGIVFGQYSHQGGPRGNDQFGSLNWAMLMLTRKFSGGGIIQGRTMLSLDPLTIRDGGYPLLLQTGETYEGEPLRDRQHPHDALMELGLLIEQPVADDVALSFYAAPSGEPALSSVAFMHRPSALDDPAAPLSHHWQDATHISYGVLTAGVFTRTAKLEASWFNGREPDEERWGIDPIRLDSWSARFTLNPNPNWSFTTGYGFLKSPETLHPDESVRRYSASALYGAQRGNGSLAASLIWGANRAHGELTHALLGETMWKLDAQNTLTARAELVQKSGEELFGHHGTVDPDAHFDIKTLSAGYLREIARPFGTTLGLGARGTVNFVPQQLEAAYGSRTPLGLFVFARLRPASAPAAERH